MRSFINRWMTVGILLLGLTGCEKSIDRTIRFQIRNETTSEITKAEIFAYNSLGRSRSVAVTKNLAKDSTYTQILSSGSLPDGDYEIHIKQTIGSRSYRFGYFTDGNDFRSGYAIAIKPDTIKVDYVNRDF